MTRINPNYSSQNAVGPVLSKSPALSNSRTVEQRENDKRLEELRKAIEDGSYSVNPKYVAQKIKSQLIDFDA